MTNAPQVPASENKEEFYPFYHWAEKDLQDNTRTALNVLRWAAGANGLTALAERAATGSSYVDIGVEDDDSGDFDSLWVVRISDHNPGRGGTSVNQHIRIDSGDVFGQIDRAIATALSKKSVNPRGFSTNPPIPYEPTDLKGMRALKGFRPAAQQHDYTCGPACLRAVLSYYGSHLTEAHLAKVARTTKRHGTTPENMCRTLTACARKTSVRRGATLAWCIKHLRAGHPVLLLWNDWKGHWVVLIGYDVTTGRLLFADPANRKTGLRVHTAETLEKYWSAKVAGRAYKRLGIAVT